MNVSIVIPVYKKHLSESEKASLIQCLRILNQYPITLVCPDSLNVEDYKKIALLMKKELIIIRFSKRYFNGIEGYNNLMLSSQFYKLFFKFKYILVYQLDAWVFRDELKKWCNLKYDYIGGPIVSRSNSELILFGGNGGFSLRKVSSHIRLLSKSYIYKKPTRIIEYHKQFHSGFSFLIRLPLMLMRIMGYQNTNKNLLKNFGRNEDVFWFEYAPKFSPKFKVCLPPNNIPFAFEKEPSFLFKKNNNKLPFGCHAWEKYEPEFWSQYIN